MTSFSIPEHKLRLIEKNNNNNDNKWPWIVSSIDIYRYLFLKRYDNFLFMKVNLSKSNLWKVKTFQTYFVFSKASDGVSTT